LALAARIAREPGSSFDGAEPTAINKNVSESLRAITPRREDGSSCNHQE
jgi:hypothetical protein